MKIDSHQHFWRYTPGQYRWIDAAKVTIARDFLPADLAREQEPLGFDGCIAVQARQSVAESDWLLGLADAAPRVKGVVGWVDLRDPRVEADLERLASHPRFVGVRHVVQDEPDDRFLLGPEFVRGIAALAKYDLTYDLLVFPNQLPACIELARRFPNQPLVLDHIAKPYMKTGELEPWTKLIRELAQCPNVCCKISGMVTETHWGRWRCEDFVPYMNVVWEAFGEDRVMFGSDWPVCLLSGSYRQVYDVAETTAKTMSEAVRHKFYTANVLNFYGVK